MAAKLQHCPYKRRKEEGLSTIIHPSEKGEEAPKCILMSVITNQNNKTVLSRPNEVTASSVRNRLAGVCFPQMSLISVRRAFTYFTVPESGAPPGPEA